MCNYTIALKPPSYLGNWGEDFDSFNCLISDLLADFSRGDEDDNRGSGR
jgi:hypothetical protein